MNDNLIVLKIFAVIVCCLTIIFIPYSLNDQHSIPIGTEPVTFFQCLVIRIKYKIIPSDFFNIDPDKYSITIDYENHKIILTSRSRRNVSTIYVPPVHY